MKKNYKHEIRLIADLIPYINNSRTHSDDQVNQIASSIKEFGFTNPILIDEHGGIIAGHGRVMAAKKLGMIDAPCLILDGLTDAQKKAYVIADNQLALNADWDWEKLKLEIETLQDFNFDIDLLGFDASLIDSMYVDDSDDIGVADDGLMDYLNRDVKTLTIALPVSEYNTVFDFLDDYASDHGCENISMALYEVINKL